MTYFAAGVVLAGQVALWFGQRRLSAEFATAVEEARKSITLSQTLSASDRDMIDRLSAHGISVLEATDRIEAASAVVAADLSQAHDRADAIMDGAPGEAADAASQKGTSPDGIA